MSYCITIREHGCPVVDDSDWLMLPAASRIISDGPRYKSCG